MQTKTKSGEININQILKEIKKEIARKKKEGLYPKDLEKEIDKLTRTSDLEGLDQFSIAIKGFKEHSFIKHDILHPSSKPLIGKPVTFFKKIIRRATAWYIKSVTDQINLLNNYTVNAFNDIQTELKFLKRQISVKNKIIDHLNEEITVLANPNKSILWENIYPNINAVSDDQNNSKPQKAHLIYFRGKNNVLDIGCGQGDFLELLKEHNIKAIGLDVNPLMIEKCISKGLSVVQQDALSYLQDTPNNSFEGINISHVAEQFTVNYLCMVLEKCFKKLKLDCYLIIRALNPSNIAYSLIEFSKDLTINRLIHPDTFRSILESLGFSDISIDFQDATILANKEYLIVAKKPGS